MMDFALRAQLDLLARTFPSPQQIAGLSVLDIGCGCVRGSAEVDANRGTWEPWLCRAVTLLKGHAVGIDIGRVSDADTFEFHRCDLTCNDPLSKFSDQSFDAISCSNLLSSPHLVYFLELNRQQRETLGSQLKTHTQRLLKPGGIILNFDQQLDNH